MASSVPFDVESAEFLADPYRYYAEARERDPVWWDEGIQSWWLLRYADVDTALQHPQLVVGNALFYQMEHQFPDLERADLEPIYSVLGSMLVFQDPPNHTRLRALLSKAFTPRVVENLRGTIQGLIDELLDAVAPAGRMDLIADLAYPLPVTVIARLLGIPDDDRARFKGWSDQVVKIANNPHMTHETLESVRTGVQAMVDYLDTLFVRYRAHPEDNLISALVGVEEQGDRLSRNELYGTCVLLMVAGHETTTNLIGNGALALLRHPDQLARLRDNPGLMPRAVDEMLRYDPPLQVINRLAADEVLLGGKTIKPGSNVLVLLGAANRDPAQFPDPDRFDIGRQHSRIASFGFGPHYCIGAPLARLEAELAFTSLLKRFPGLRLATDSVEHGKPFALRRLLALPVAW